MDDQSLLSQYIAAQDVAAFTELTQRYARLVKGVCVRILGNSHDAEEIAQECFFDLAQNAQQIHSSVAGWLHRAATTKSLNVLRSRSRRRARERAVGQEIAAPSGEAESTASELRGVIDRALTELPDELRLPTILHYFNGRSQREVAVELGVNQSTISRRMQDALNHLRERLVGAGYVTTAPAIVMAMQNQATDAIADSSLAHVATAASAGKAAGSITLAGCLKAGSAALLSTLSVLLFGGWLTCLVGIGLTCFIWRFRPVWFAELFSDPGSVSVYEQPTFFLGHWKWTTQPPDWRSQAAVAMLWSVLFFGLSAAFALGSHTVPWGTVVWGLLVGLSFLIHASRIIVCVRRVATNRAADSIPAESNLASPKVHFWDQLAGLPINDPTLTWVDVTQLTVIGIAGIGVTVQLAFQPNWNGILPAATLCAAIGAGMLYSGIWLSRRLLISQPTQSDLRQVNATPSASKVTNGIVGCGAAIIAALSWATVCNPASVRGPALSIAALQTAALGWMVYRWSIRCRWLQPTLVRRAVPWLLVICFVLNSGVCFANWLK